MRVADYIVKRMKEVGVDCVFIVTGRGLLYLSDALAANKEIKSISTHHEQGAAYAAYAYAERKGTVGACMVSTGCASTNAITSVMCAWQDEVPMLVISGQNMLAETTYHTHAKIRTYGQQENDIIALVKPITKYAVMLESAEEIGSVMDRAIYEATHGRKGPVWVDVPLDLQNMRIDEEELSHFTPPVVKKESHDYSKIVDLLSQSQRPVLLIGAGIRRADAIEKLHEFVKTACIPVVYDASAVDLVADENQWSIGAAGSMGATRAGNFAVQNADLVLAVGCRLSTMLTGSEREKFARMAKLVVVDIDEHELKENCFRDMTLIREDPGCFLDFLLQCTDDFKADRTKWLEKCRHWKRVFPKNIYKEQKLQGKLDMYEVAECIGSCADDHAVVITDAGMEELIFPTTMCLKQGARVIHPVSQGAMGFAVPAILGAHYAGGGQVISVVGDGSIMMNLQELETIRMHQIPAKIFVIQNECYAVIRQRQKELFRNRTIGTDSENGVTVPNFAKVADCFGLAYVRVEQRNLLKESVCGVLASQQAVLCEVVCTEEQQFLKNAYVMNQKRKLLRRSLEDQAPFLERDVVRTEMVIEPIEME